jgi:outer membrane protein OmpA-like peptidoglycan-associated protein
MTRYIKHSGRFGAILGITLLAACGMENRQVTNAPPPPPPPASAQASVYQVGFAAGSSDIDPAGHRTIEDVSSVVDGRTHVLVTIVGRTDAVGSPDANMQLSQKRAFAVRDELVSMGKIDPTHVNTAWTGEEKQDVGTYNGTPAAGNRVVDIYIH